MIAYSSGNHAQGVAAAAQLLGVSDDTVRRWIEQGLLPVTDAVPAEIPGDAVAARAVALAEEAKKAGDVLSSARNRLASDMSIPPKRAFHL